MKKLFRQILRDELGSLDAMAYVLIVTILAIGGITGLTTLRDGIIQEYADYGIALRHLNQGYKLKVPLENVSFDADDDTTYTPIEVKDEDGWGTSGGGLGQISLTGTPGGEGAGLPNPLENEPGMPKPGAGGENAAVKAPTGTSSRFPAPTGSG